jgi:hypothetical protein
MTASQLAITYPEADATHDAARFQWLPVSVWDEELVYSLYCSETCLMNAWHNKIHDRNLICF